MNVMAIDLGGTKLAAAIFNSKGASLHKQIIAIDNRQGSEVGLLITQQIQQFIAFAKSNKMDINAIGVSIPGIYYSKTGCVWAPNIPGWDNYPLREEISSLAEIKNINVNIDSDRACYILGETWQGATRGSNNAIFLAVGTGIGAGILVDGKILHGHGDIGGAVGWMGLHRPYRTEYKTCGCFEYHASGQGIARITRELITRDQEYSGFLKNKPVEQITAHDVFEAYQRDDPIAKQVLDSCVQFWGMAVANLVSIFNPEKIVLGGGIFGPAAQFLERIKQEACLWAQPISFQQVSLEVSVLGGDAGLIGAAYLALENLNACT